MDAATALLFVVRWTPDSIPSLRGRLEATFNDYTEAMRYAHRLGKDLEVVLPDGQVLNPWRMAAALS